LKQRGRARQLGAIERRLSVARRQSGCGGETKGIEAEKDRQVFMFVLRIPKTLEEWSSRGSAKASFDDGVISWTGTGQPGMQVACMAQAVS
jgi:hypothetical protein